MKRPLIILLIVACTSLGSWSVFGWQKIDFEREIRPILRESCYRCHGAGMQSAGLRLDSREGVLAGGVSGKAIIPGRGEESLLYRRVTGLAEGPAMPLQGNRLTPEQLLQIRTWIDQGAEWPAAAAGGPAAVTKHWAYVKPVRPDLPAVRNASWPRNPIDNFILARLEEEGLSPSPEASRETLLRRASLDLTGLPPSLSQIDSFLADARPDAYERAVDQLLGSPRYGERWARPWLDLARYADTNGYEKDNRRSMWLYRDWVIDAFNDDMPFDQFTVEQIAGDLLPGSSNEQKIATGFHRNTMINEEGGVDPEEYRVAAILDRVDTTASVWLGSTVACAQCHDHKFDPFSQEEYYRVFAFFNNTEDEIGTFRRTERASRGSNLRIPPPRNLASHRKTAEDQIAELEAEMSRPRDEVDAAQAKWEAETRSLIPGWSIAQPLRSFSSSGAGLTSLEDGSILASGNVAGRDTYFLVADTPESSITAIRLELLPHPTLPGGGVSRGAAGSIVLTGFEVEAAARAGQNAGETVKLVDAVAPHGSNPKGAVDDDADTGWSVRADRLGSESETHVVFVPARPFGFPGGTRLTIRLKHEDATPEQTLGRFRIAVTAGRDALKSGRIPLRVQALLAIPPGDRSPDQKSALTRYYRGTTPAFAQMREKLARQRALWAELSSPGVMVMRELPEPRKTHIHIRGSFLNVGKEVSPGVPAALHPFLEKESLNRLGLARWLVSPENPLVARVAMNRIWMEYFGRGIVETVEDFGSQGSPPSNPELLDWLATEFIRQKWSHKAIHRLIVTSATYRQSSRVRPELLERDPANRLLARGPRLRLEAEGVRDNLLEIGGLLTAKMWGPSVFPSQPEGIWNLVYNDDTWVESMGEDRYRRGLYTFWRRTAPYPMFTTFDAPSREALCTRRVPTNTPLQSLTLLNDPAFFDAARGLARRIIAEGGADPRKAVAYAFRLCTARLPEARELERLADLFDQERRRFREKPAAAREIALQGEVKPAQGTDDALFAAWTVVANVLLNLDETLTKG